MKKDKVKIRKYEFFLKKNSKNQQKENFSIPTLSII